MTRLDCSPEAIYSCNDPVEKLFKARYAWSGACLRLAMLENIFNQLNGVKLYTEQLQQVRREVRPRSLLPYQDDRPALEEAIALAVQAKQASFELLEQVKSETKNGPL